MKHRKPTWVMERGVCTESLAMKVALDNRVSIDVVTRADGILHEILALESNPQENPASQAGFATLQDQVFCRTTGFSIQVFPEVFAEGLRYHLGFHQGFLAYSAEIVACDSWTVQKDLA